MRRPRPYPSRRHSALARYPSPTCVAAALNRSRRAPPRLVAAVAVLALGGAGASVAASRRRPRRAASLPRSRVISHNAGRSDRLPGQASRSHEHTFVSSASTNVLEPRLPVGTARRNHRATAPRTGADLYASSKPQPTGATIYRRLCVAPVRRSCRTRDDRGQPPSLPEPGRDAGHAMVELLLRRAASRWAARPGCGGRGATVSRAPRLEVNFPDCSSRKVDSRTTRPTWPTRSRGGVRRATRLVPEISIVPAIRRSPAASSSPPEARTRGTPTS
jgi:hypothetical protein